MLSLRKREADLEREALLGPAGAAAAKDDGTAATLGSASVSRAICTCKLSGLTNATRDRFFFIALTDAASLVAAAAGRVVEADAEGAGVSAAAAASAFRLRMPTGLGEGMPARRARSREP